MRRGLRGIVAAASVVAALTLAACTGAPASSETSTSPDAPAPAPAPEFEWVVVKFSFDDLDAGFALRDGLSQWRIEANDAVKAAGVGFLDGDELGGGSYDIYLAGDDRDAIWAVLEPVLETVPAEWSVVWLMASRDDGEPTVVLP